jgi:hypothetical protein
MCLFLSIECLNNFKHTNDNAKKGTVLTHLLATPSVREFV